MLFENNGENQKARAKMLYIKGIVKSRPNQVERKYINRCRSGEEVFYCNDRFVFVSKDI